MQRVDRPNALAPRLTTLEMKRLGPCNVTYPAFRESIFYDPRVNTALRGRARQPEGLSGEHASRRMWTAHGPLIDPRLPKTTVAPGTAFRNECLSADQLYSSSRNSLGYDVHRSLRGSSLCSSTKRFQSHSCTPESVGPGSYDTQRKPRGLLTDPPPRLEGGFPLPDRLKQWGGKRLDSRAMDSAGSWQITSEKQAAVRFSFRKARGATWIEQVELRQQREDPLARKPCVAKPASPEQRLPHFLQGTRNPVYLKTHSTTADANSVSSASATTSSLPSTAPYTDESENYSES